MSPSGNNRQPKPKHLHQNISWNLFENVSVRKKNRLKFRDLEPKGSSPAGLGPGPLREAGKTDSCYLSRSLLLSLSLSISFSLFIYLSLLHLSLSLSLRCSILCCFFATNILFEQLADLEGGLCISFKYFFNSDFPVLVDSEGLLREWPRN